MRRGLKAKPWTDRSFRARLFMAAIDRSTLPFTDDNVDAIRIRAWESHIPAEKGSI